MKKFFQEFKAFISRGNVMDLAVGVIIGGAFSNRFDGLDHQTAAQLYRRRGDPGQDSSAGR